jgi:hypothetical protein
MTLDGKGFYFKSAATIRQPLDVLLIGVTETLKQCSAADEYGINEGKRQRDEGTKERKRSSGKN